MTSKLSIFNSCLLHLEERGLSTLSETGPRKTALDDAWSDTVAYCIEAGYWTFAMRTNQIYKNDSATPGFGPANSFTKPSDWVRTYRISDTENLETPLLDLIDEGGVWYSNSDPLYVKYVSNDASYGNDMSLWPSTFAEYVANRLAVKTCVRITGNGTRLDLLLKLEDRARRKAADKDAMNEPPTQPIRGSWANSRSASSSFQPPSNRTITN